MSAARAAEKGQVVAGAADAPDAAEPASGDR
jgi:hypothetical protein